MNAFCNETAMSTAPAIEPSETRERIKRVALELFGQHDPDSVSVREIGRAAGQKNVSLLNYYFGSKEGLLHELIHDFARVHDADRQRRLKALESRPEPASMRDILEVVLSRPHDSFPKEDIEGPLGAFGDMMLSKKADLLFETLSPELSTGTRTGLGLLRRMLPDLPEPVLSQRLRLLLLLGFSVQSTRRDALHHPHLWPDGWTGDIGQQNLIDAAIGLLLQPVSAETDQVLGV